MRAVRRILTTVAIAFVGVLAHAEPAAAHGTGGPTATNYLTRLRAVDPAVPGVRVRAVEAGRRFEVTNTGAEDVVVLGYQDEPFLRVGREGVFENLRSPATYVSSTREGDVVVPGTTDPTAAPEWRKVSDGRTARWHDHRVHWMGDRDPPAVRREPGRRHVVLPDWAVPMQVGERRVEARGDLLWVPGPSPVPWLALAVGLGTIALVAVLRGGARWAAVLLVILLVVDVANVAGIEAAMADGGAGRRVGRVLVGGFFVVIGWAAAVAGVRLLLRRDHGGLVYAAVSAGLVVLFGGVAEWGSLMHSQVPSAWPPPVARALVAASLGVGLALLAGSVVHLRGSEPSAAAVE